MKRPFILLSAALLAGVFLSGCGSEVSDLNRKAIESLEKGDLKAAEESLKEAVRLDPTNRTLRKNLVEVHFRQEDWPRAVQLLKATREIVGLGSDLEIRALLAQAHIQAGETQQGAAVVRELLEEDPENEFYLYLDGVSATSPRRAVESLEKAIAKNPDRKESYLALANAQAFDGETERARETLDLFTGKFGSSLDASLQRVSLCLRDNDFEMAQKELDAVLAEHGDEPLAQLYSAYLAVADRRIDEALEIFESLDGVEGITQEARLGQSLCHLIQGDPNVAIELCEQILKEDETETVAMNLQGLGQLKRLQRFLAKQSFEKSLAANPNQPTIQALVDRIGSQ